MKKYLLALTVSSMLAVPAQAATLVSLDRATFQTAIMNGALLGVQDFDSLAAGSILSNDGFISYFSSTGDPIVTSTFLTSTGANGLGRTPIEFFASSDTLTLTFASAISAFAIDINTFAPADGAYRAVLNTGDDAFSIFETFPGVGTGQFVGFTSLTPFTSLTLSAENGFSYTVDTVIYGDRAQVGAVPEPATWAFMIFGFGAIGGAMRRRRKANLKVSYAFKHQ